ncbi:MAG: hypothetical protein AAFY06_09745, partial [Pseudomonadota bacterium]
MAKRPSGKNTSGRGQRDLTVKVKTAKGRKLSSTRWLQRQLNDPYVKRAQAEGYRVQRCFCPRVALPFSHSFLRFQNTVCSHLRVKHA